MPGTPTAGLPPGQPGASVALPAGVLGQTLAAAAAAVRSAVNAVVQAATPAAAAPPSSALPGAAPAPGPPPTAATATLPVAATAALLSARVPAAATAAPAPLALAQAPVGPPVAPPLAPPASNAAAQLAVRGASGASDAVALPAPAALARPTEAVQPPPGRTDLAPAGRADPSIRATAVQGGLPAGALAATPAAAAAVAGSTVAMAGLVGLPAGVAPGASPVDARALPLAAGGDRAGGARADVMLAGVYTGSGPARRRLRRGVRVLPTRMTGWLLAMGAGGRLVAVSRSEEAAEEQAVLAAAMQWTFWTLAIVAYACLGFGILALLPAGGVPSADNHRRWMGGFALAGLAAAAGAWWLGRRLARRGAAAGRRA